MRAPRLVVVPIAAAVLALPLAGCGKDKPKLPRADAHELIVLLQQADRRANAAKPACNGLASTTIPDLEAKVASLPGNIDPDIRSTLRDGVANLRTLIEAKCSNVKPVPPKTNTETTPTTQPPSTVTTAPHTVTAPSSTPSSTPHSNPSSSPSSSPQSNPSGGTPPGAVNTP